MRLFKRKDTPDPKENVLQSVGQTPIERNYEKEKFPGEFDVEQPKGKVFDKKPFKMELEAEKRYAWCTCGRSKIGVCETISFICM